MFRPAFLLGDSQCFLGSNLYRWNSDALILFIYFVHSDMRLLANVSSFATLRDWS